MIVDECVEEKEPVVEFCCSNQPPYRQGYAENTNTAHEVDHAARSFPLLALSGRAATDQGSAVVMRTK